MGSSGFKGESIVREPSFDAEEDMLVMVSGETNQKDSIEGLTLKANILILSYNRPRMLREAVESVLGQDYPNFDLYIVDDASENFSPWDLISEYQDERLLIAQASPISLATRLVSSRLGKNLNEVINQLPDEEPVYYLCDDDLMGENWLARSVRALQMYPETHVIQGEAWYFHDGQDLSEAIYGMPKHAVESTLPTMYWSTGSFTHRALCSKREGIWWTDNTHLHSQDTNFLTDIWAAHQNYGAINKPAVYRREHENTLSAKLGRKDEDGFYSVGFVPGKATEEMIRVME